MINIPQDLTAEERDYLESTLKIIGTSPALESIWLMMDLAWQSSGCDRKDPTPEQLAKFYNSPVWLLNGLFIEQHEVSVGHRRKFTEAILDLRPGQVCDYGGGYGSLARMIAKDSSAISVDLFEPHPHRSSLGFSAELVNLRHVAQLYGPYDVIIATDVFEHVTDPLAEVEKTSLHLKPGGRYLIANCFYPVIKCHLPCTFHFRNSFVSILSEMNLKPVRQVAYGTIFEKTGEVRVTPRIRRLEKRSRIKFAYFGFLDSFRELRKLCLPGASVL